ncbi:hypothetical protein GCM10010377_04320 [Streptomyces viridiviolaceus]|nr:hypothetical protein GCM10010377_04320 [Streptomyces viridiviolaceus]
MSAETVRKAAARASVRGAGGRSDHLADAQVLERPGSVRHLRAGAGAASLARGDASGEKIRGFSVT